MIDDLGAGNLKMIDISSFNKSLKITWIKEYLDNNNKGKWKIFFDVDLKKHGCQSFFSYNLNVRDTLSTITSDTFLKQLLGIWAEVNFEPEIISREHFLDQHLWHMHNSNNKTEKLIFKGNNLGETSFRTGQHLSFVK